MRARRRVGDRALHPRILIDPILGHAVPEHAGVVVGNKVSGRGGAQQMRPDFSASDKRTKHFGILRERAEQLLSRRYFPLDGFRSGIETKRHAMRERVIPDAMTLSRGALGEFHSLARREILPENEE